MSELQDEKYESFLKLYRASEKCLFRYVLALLPNYSAAEEIMQDTLIVMWRKFDQFRSGTNFIAWGMQIARFNVLNYQRRKRTGVVLFEEETLDNITLYQEKHASSIEDDYLNALNECTEKLPENSKKLISMRYVENTSVIDIATKFQKTLNSTYKALSRIHHALLICVERKVAKGETV